MKRNACFGLFLILFAFIAGAQPMDAQAISFGDNGGDLQLDPSGAVSVRAGQTLSLTVKVTNKSSNSVLCASLQAAVIDPWTGTRILGPNSITVNQSLDGDYWSCDQFDNCTHIPGGSTTATVQLAIPRTVPGTYTSTVNKTLAVVIYSLDGSSVVRGVTGWGFFATQ